MRHCLRRPAAAGFTLVEVVIALSLVALLMLGLVTALATFGRTSASMEARSERGDEARLVSDFLRASLGRVAEHYRMNIAENSDVTMFVGGPREVQWLGVMPARHGAGGLHQFRLLAAADAHGPALLLQYQPYIGGDAMPDWAQADTRVLVDSLTHFDVTYAGDDPTAWTDLWQNEKETPHLIRLAIATEREVWPEVVVRVRRVGRGRSVVTVGG